jgi:hypothetical protein
MRITRLGSLGTLIRERKVEHMKNPGFSLESRFRGVEKALANPKTPPRLLPSLRRRAKELSIELARKQTKRGPGLFAFLRRKG